MGKLFRSGGTYLRFYYYNLLQWFFVCDFHRTSFGLLLSDKGSTWFSEFIFHLFNPSSQSMVFFSSLHITYMCGC